MYNYLIIFCFTLFYTSVFYPRNFKKKTAFVPCKSFKHDGATLTVGVAEVTVNRQPNPSEVYLCVKYFGDEGTPEAVVTFTPDKAVEIAEALLGFARVAHKQDGRV